MRRGVLLLAIAAVVATWAGSRQQQRALAAETARLLGAATAIADTESVDLTRAELPAPVARYLRLAVPYPRKIDEVRIRQSGTLRSNTETERWMAFDSEHLVVPPATGFLWNARVQIAPLLHVRVRDALIEGSGSGRVALLSAFTVRAADGGLEMNAGSLHRYLAEAVWYPTALFPGPNLRWTDVSATAALATLTHRGVSVSLEFRFDDSGLVSGIYTPARWGTFPGGFRQAPWQGHFSDYRERQGMLVPTHGEVGWYIDDQWRTVWKGTISAYDARHRSPS